MQRIPDLRVVLKSSAPRVTAFMIVRAAGRVIGRLAEKSTVGVAGADEAAAELWISRRQVSRWSGGGARVKVW